MTVVRSFMEHPVPDREQTITRRDTILYALSVGFGDDATDRDQLRFVTGPDLVAVPTMADVLAHPGPWMKELPIDWSKVVQAEQRVELFQPLPVEAHVISRTRKLGVVDKGPATGAFATFARDISEFATGRLLATVTQTNACRGDGGGGSCGAPPPPLLRVPDATPDFVVDARVPASAALLYSTHGDRNPLHNDPAVARQAGFDRPILHGLCTLGYAMRAVLQAACAFETTRLHGYAARFTAPFFPGEMLRTCIWKSGETVSFQALALERERVVLDHGSVLVR